MVKRIFVGIPVGEELRYDIAAFTLGEGREMASGFDVRWTAPRNLHVTLVPPWEESGADSIISRLKTCSGTVNTFNLHFQTVSLGPDSKHPRMVWARAEKTKEIEDLRLKIYEALGTRPEARAFNPHITLGRIRHASEGDAARKPQSVNWVLPVRSFVLYESHLQPEGAEYEVLEEVGIN